MAAHVSGLIYDGATCTDAADVERRIGMEDVVVITPYNVHLFDIRQRVPGAPVGTVDKFQGQEAPVAIYFWRRPVRRILRAA